MRSKAPLTLMEQIIMVLVFALAAALCLRCFVWADQKSKQDEARDQAVILTQNAAEILKSAGGETFLAAAGLDVVYPYDYDRTPFQIYYDGDFARCEEGDHTYRLDMEPTESSVEGLWIAEIRFSDLSGNVLYELPVAGQEVSRDG